MSVFMYVIFMPIQVAARSKAYVLASWLLGSRVRNPLVAWMFVLMFICCVVLCRQRPLRRADHSSRGVIPPVNKITKPPV
jgi:hypothetical protein